MSEDARLAATPVLEPTGPAVTQEPGTPARNSIFRAPMDGFWPDKNVYLHPTLTHTRMQKNPASIRGQGPVREGSRVRLGPAVARLPRSRDLIA